MTAVFLDACALVPITLVNVILTAAEDALLRPHWSPEVIEEAVRAILLSRPSLDEARVRGRFSAMDAAFKGASMSGDVSTLDRSAFPDPDDLHVVAAAVAAGATTVVTANVRDFPEAAMAKLGITVQSPDQLLLDLLENDPQGMIDVVAKVAGSLRNPTRTPNDILTGLGLAGAR
ncbi:MAG: PIN domain-containing protein, partial [Bifidobacteriaceae bacterium]|nr:PIN domain-containing protein [Bifidobacteriaceae bacterium]